MFGGIFLLLEFLPHLLPFLFNLPRLYLQLRLKLFNLGSEILGNNLVLLSLHSILLALSYLPLQLVYDLPLLQDLGGGLIKLVGLFSHVLRRNPDHVLPLHFKALRETLSILLGSSC